MTFIWAYQPNSESAKALSEGTGFKRLKHEGSKAMGRDHPTLINWGGCNIGHPYYHNFEVINKPEAVALCSDKRAFFKWVHNFYDEPEAARFIMPRFWTSHNAATAWMEEHPGQDMVARTLLRAHGGRGIVITNDPDQLPNCQLYTEYVKKKDEYRVHFFENNIFHVQRKARVLDVPDDKVNWKIRNHDNGFIYEQQNVELPKQVGYAAADMIQFLTENIDITFGAIDLIYNKKQDKGYVLEVNTAPGLTGTTLKKYVDIFKQNYG